MSVNADFGVCLVQFSDGKTWTRAQVIRMTIPGSNPRPTLTSVTVPAVGHDQTVADSTVTPSLAVDVLTLTTLAAGRGTLSLANGTLTYVAPFDIGTGYSRLSCHGPAQQFGLRHLHEDGRRWTDPHRGAASCRSRRVVVPFHLLR